MFEIEFNVAIALFSIGLYGITSKNDFLRIFFSLEMLLNAVVLMLASSANRFDMVANLSFAYLVIVIATLEAAAGVLIFILANKLEDRVMVDDYNQRVES